MMQRKIVLSITVALTFLAASGCSKKEAPVTAPPAVVVESPPPAPPAPAPAPVVDEVEKPVEKSLQELQAEFESKGLLGDVYYDLDKADLREDAKARLAKNAELMSSRPELSFTIGGHCDERGTNEYNIALGLRRASAAADFLASKGVPSSRLKTISYGEERPFCTLSNEECWQKNRRAQFTLTGRN